MGAAEKQPVNYHSSLQWEGDVLYPVPGSLVPESHRHTGKSSAKAHKDY